MNTYQTNQNEVKEDAAPCSTYSLPAENAKGQINSVVKTIEIYNAKYIKANLKIFDLVEFLKIEIHGSKICSIYHTENTPSLHLYEGTNTFHDFSSGNYGGVIQFYMDYKKIDFKTALVELTEILKNHKNSSSISVEENSGSKDSFISPFSIVYPEELHLISNEENTSGLSEEKIKETKSKQLKNILDHRKKVIAKVYDALFKFLRPKGFTEDVYYYLTGTKRKLNNDSLERFICQIHNNRETIQFLKDTFSDYELMMSGLFSKNYFLPSKHPVLIFDEGKLGYNYIRGRYFQNGSPDLPSNENVSKYIGPKNNSGLLSVKRFFNSYWHFRTNWDQLNNLYVFEGEFDTILAEQFGLDSIGILGATSLPKYQSVLNLFGRIFLCFDHDKAGNTATEKMIEQLLKENPDYMISVVKFLKHKDFTDWYEKGKDLHNDPDVEILDASKPEGKKIIKLDDFKPTGAKLSLKKKPLEEQNSHETKINSFSKEVE